MKHLMMASSWTLNERGEAWMAWAILALAVVSLAVSYRHSPLRGWKRVAAQLSKVLVFALLALLLLDPQRISEAPEKGANSVAILADNSASLGVLDPATKQAFGEPAVKALKSQGGTRPAWLKDLADTFSVDGFLFDERLHETGDFAKLGFDGQRSALVGALQSVLQRNEKRPLAATLLFSDGNATDAAALEKLLSTPARAPVYPIMVGAITPPKDIVLTHVGATQTPFEDSPVALDASVTAQGFGGEELAMVIRDEQGKTVHTEKHRLGTDETAHTFRARFRPAKSGVSVYRVTVLPSSQVALIGEASKLKAASAEVTLDNNERSIAIDRRGGPYRVLYLSGRPNWEFKFLRRSLEPDTEIHLVGLIRIAKREPKFEWRGRAGETSNPLFRGFKSDAPEEAQRYDQPVLIRLGIDDKKELSDGFPKSADELFGTYRAIIIDDLEASFFTQEQMDLLERFVSLRGGSLLLLGGQESFQQGGYENTAVGRMAPVYLDRLPKGEAIQDARFNLTREGWLEPWMRLRDHEDEERARLEHMPPFFTVNPVAAIKPGASILATVVDARQKAHPAWVVQRYGSGRVAAVTVGDVWRWGMRDPESRTDMEKAWRQLVRSLVVDVPDRVELQTNVEPTSAHDLLKLQVRVHDKAFRGIDDAVVAVSVTGPDGKAIDVPAEPSATEAGLYEAPYHATASGAYRIKATVKDGDGKPVGDRETGLALNPQSDELQALSVNRDLLEKIAAWSGGRVIRLDELPALIKTLPEAKLPVMEVRSEPLWHHAWVLLLLAALLGFEWALRRRWSWQ